MMGVPPRPAGGGGGVRDTGHGGSLTTVHSINETVTVIGLGLSDRIQRSLATTTAIESLLSRTRHVKQNVKRWRRHDGASLGRGRSV